jgi:Leucine-rich repeat (LRR) protein
LDNLPQKITILYCSSNQIVSLNNLPQSLTELDCSNNQINNVNYLPESLFILRCNNNNLSNEIMEIINNNTVQEAINILVEKSLMYTNNSYILK